MGRLNGDREVRATVEFLRIKHLPSRELDDAGLEAIRSALTEALRRPGSKAELRPKQAHALHDLGIYNGLVFGARVGAGKTLTSLLAPVMLDPAPKTPLLLLPASLVQKTKNEAAKLSIDWRICKGLQIASFESIGVVGGANFLELECKPDFIIIDECHRAKNLKAGVVRRLVRYMKLRPTTRVLVMSGTLFKASIKDAAHLIQWALKGSSPVPMFHTEVEMWADALDDGNRVGALKRADPGPLVDLASAEDQKLLREGKISKITCARRGFQKRFRETPGVVLTTGEQVDCSLNIVGIKYDVNQATEDNFRHLRATWCTPDDWELVEAVEVWACARQLALGMHYVWDPRPPDEWRVRRKVWKSFVRDVLKSSRKLDTEGQVAVACREGALDRSAFDAWMEIRPSFTPRSKAVWHDNTALLLCQRWMAKHDGVVWTEHGFFARELSRISGVPYFGEGGLTADGQDLNVLAARILDPGDRTRPMPIIASIKANSTGRNLQGWDRMLVTSPPPGADAWEQMLGRHHRDGQKSDEVNCDVLIGCWEHTDIWNKANDLAKTTQDIDGSSQKLCIATSTMPAVEYLPGPRWQKVSDEKEAA